MSVPLTPDPALCDALRADLSAVGYTADAVRGAWGPLADEAVGHAMTGPAVRALSGRTDALATLLRVLFLGLSAPASAVDAALPRLGAAGLTALGLASQHRDALVAEALVRPQDLDEPGAGWWIASDLDEAALQRRDSHGVLPTDHVLGVGGASLTLAGLQIPSPGARVLDLGTGCGIQALRSLREADRVVATDISERAVAFTLLNARLAGVDDRLEVRVGNLFDPVRRDRFDRVVSNPPFVITPRAGVPAYEYRDAGMAGDELVAAFVRGVGEVLVEGGIAQLLGNWEYCGGDGLERVRQWVAASPVPLDAWVVERERLDPLAYAELWVRDGGTVPGSVEYEQLVQAWLDDFAARGVTEVGFGYLLLRRGTGALARYEKIPQAVSGPLGAHLGASLAAWDQLAGMDDEALAAAQAIVARDVTEARHFVPGQADPSVIELRQGGGFGRALVVDPALAALVGACDGELSVGVLVGAIAQLLEVDEVALAADLLPRVRELVFTGFLRLADPSR